VTGKLIFDQGQILAVTTHVKSIVSQEAMGNAIDFNVEGTSSHQFAVTNATADNATLHHNVQNVSFRFDGMGQDRTFNSGNQKDLDGLFGPPVKDILSKSYDIIVDPAGKVLLAKPEKIELAKSDDRLAIVFNMLRDITDVVYPPKKSGSSLFRVLPDSAVSIGDKWTEATESETGKTFTEYTLSAINDSLIVVDIKGKSSSITKAEMMGMPTTSTMSTNYKGTITLDKQRASCGKKTLPRNQPAARKQWAEPCRLRLNRPSQLP
jgi:hypothetical protein